MYPLQYYILKHEAYVMTHVCIAILYHKQAEFHRKVGIEVTEVFKGGSLGHGTAVEHHFDIDLVLYSRSEPKYNVVLCEPHYWHTRTCLTAGLTVEGAVRDGYDEYFDKIDSYLKEQLRGIYFPEDERTNVAIKFAIKLPGASPIDVDLILSPYFTDQHDMLRSLMKVHKSERLKM